MTHNLNNILSPQKTHHRSSIYQLHVVYRLTENSKIIMISLLSEKVIIFWSHHNNHDAGAPIIFARNIADLIDEIKAKCATNISRLPLSTANIINKKILLRSLCDDTEIITSNNHVNICTSFRIINKKIIMSVKICGQNIDTISATIEI